MGTKSLNVFLSSHMTISVPGQLTEKENGLRLVDQAIGLTKNLTLKGVMTLNTVSDQLVVLSTQIFPRLEIREGRKTGQNPFVEV